MNIVVKPENKNIKSYIEKNISYFLLPLKDYSVEYSNYYTLEEIKSIRENYKDINIFVSINKNIFNDEIEPLKKILLELDSLNIKGIFYYDLALVNLKRKLHLNFDLIWNQTHMVTNYKTCDYYHEMGVKYALLSKEITKDEIIEIINKSKITPIVELISYPSVAFSKRKLITNYYKELNKEKKDEIEVEEKITTDKYLLKEDNDGTTFIKKDLVNGSSVLEELLNNNLEYILLKEDFIEHNLFMKTLDNINYFITNYKKLNEEANNDWLNKQEQLLGSNTGFFFKKTIYKVK